MKTLDYRESRASGLTSYFAWPQYENKLVIFANHIMILIPLFMQCGYCKRSVFLSKEYKPLTARVPKFGLHKGCKKLMAFRNEFAHCDYSKTVHYINSDSIQASKEKVSKVKPVLTSIFFWIFVFVITRMVIKYLIKMFTS